MFIYLSLSRRNPHTVTLINPRIPESRCGYSCIPTPASIPSTFYFSCTLNGGCCWVGRALALSCRTLCNTCIPWGYYPYCCPVRFLCGPAPCAMLPFLFELLATEIETWKGSGSGNCAFALSVCGALSWVPAPCCLLLWRR